MPDFFDVHLARWQLTPDGAPITTHSSRLLPVRLADGAPAMLKVAVHPEERAAADMMVWWNGDGAVPVIAHDDPALLMVRATGSRSLAAMARGEEDDEASRILCDAAARLHAFAHRPPPPRLTTLREWFAPLLDEGPRDEAGGLLRRGAATARLLFASTQDEAPLHGDLHHENVLDAEAAGWLAIDPKGLFGERGFDFANLFRDPDHLVATRPGRLARQSHIVAQAAGLDRVRLLQWTMAFASLSAVWILNDGDSAAEDLEIATLAEMELRNVGVTIGDA